MSLTSILKQPEVRKQFGEEFSVPTINIDAEILAPLKSERPNHIGTAFDYLLRFTLQFLNSSVSHSSQWTAEAALSLLQGETHHRAREVVDQSKSIVEAYVASGELFDDVLRTCLHLAALDVVARTGGRYDFSDVEAVQPGEVEDLIRLHDIIPVEAFEANDLCLLNPTFGKASSLVGGADADVLIDNLLVDVKTVQEAVLTKSMLDQLVGYYTLHVIDGIGERNPKPSISKVGVYFSRHAHLETIDLDDVIDRTTYPDFVEWFARYCLAQRVKEGRQ